MNNVVADQRGRGGGWQGTGGKRMRESGQMAWCVGVAVTVELGSARQPPHSRLPPTTTVEEKSRKKRVRRDVAPTFFLLT